MKDYCIAGHWFICCELCSCLIPFQVLQRIHFAVLNFSESFNPPPAHPKHPINSEYFRQPCPGQFTSLRNPMERKAQHTNSCYVCFFRLFFFFGRIIIFIVHFANDFLLSYPYSHHHPRRKKRRRKIPPPHLRSCRCINFFLTNTITTGEKR
jgi:hypothetical protein